MKRTAMERRDASASRMHKLRFAIASIVGNSIEESVRAHWTVQVCP